MYLCSVAHCDLLRRRINTFLIIIIVVAIFCQFVNHLSLLGGPLALTAATVNAPAHEARVSLRPIYISFVCYNIAMLEDGFVLLSD
jgi:hypothetical protein